MSCEKKLAKANFFQWHFLQVLSKANIEMVLKFALEKKLFIFADEVGLIKQTVRLN